VFLAPELIRAALTPVDDTKEAAIVWLESYFQYCDQHPKDGTVSFNSDRHHHQVWFQVLFRYLFMKIRPLFKLTQRKMFTMITLSTVNVPIVSITSLSHCGPFMKCGECSFLNV
jgi:hypothetical protein